MESYVFYRSFHDALKNYSDEQYGKIIRLINLYALDGVEPETEDPVINLIFTLIKPQIDANVRRREYGSRGGRPRRNQNEETAEPKEEKKASEDSAFIQKETKSKKFTKPTVEEIDSYIKEMNYSFSAQKFFDYYESKGWVVGKSPMKNWKAACNTWSRNSFDSENVSRDSENLEEYQNYFKPKEGG